MESGELQYQNRLLVEMILSFSHLNPGHQQDPSIHTERRRLADGLSRTTEWLQPVMEALMVTNASKSPKPYPASQRNLSPQEQILGFD